VIQSNYVQAEEIDNLLAAYAPFDAASVPKPQKSNDPESAKSEQNDSDTSMNGVNHFILDVKQDLNEDTAAWIRIPNSRIDYPIVHGTDNSYYLDHDIRKRKAAAGSIFVDSRNSKGFTDFNTLIYGHNMIDGSMFSDLRNFSDFGYFSNNPAALLYLPRITYNLEIFAYIKVKDDDRIIYSSSNIELNEFIEYVRSRASQYREIQLTDQDRIVTLSTCVNDLADSRMVVLARLKLAV
jgi:sortase B